MMKKIVMSSTYRQTSNPTAELLREDPENQLLARGPAHRLSAEMIRDVVLASSGLLVDTIGGPPVKPYEPEGLWEEKSGEKYQRVMWGRAVIAAVSIRFGSVRRRHHR